MQRDINKYREMENGGNAKENFDIIQKKSAIKNVLLSDPDIIEILGTKTPKPNNKYKDSQNPTPEELDKRSEIELYNRNIKHDQIVDWIKLNGIQTEVLNFIMFDIEDRVDDYSNSKAIKDQTVSFWCLVHEDDMNTEYEISRVDLLGWIIKDLFNWSNLLGKQIHCVRDSYDIIDNKYYCRKLDFKMVTANGIFPTNNNRYDRFKY